MTRLRRLLEVLNKIPRVVLLMIGAIGPLVRVSLEVATYAMASAAVIILLEMKD